MIIKSKEQYRELIDKLKAEATIAMDTETEEFSKEKTHAFELELDGVGVYSSNVKAYIPAQYLDKEFQKILDNTEIIFHNFKFDGVILQRRGYDISKIKYQDTFLISKILNENRSSHRLKYLAESVLKVEKDKIVEFRDVNKRPVLEEYGLFPDEFKKDSKEWLKNLGKYCIDDCKYTYKLFNKFYPLLEEKNLLKVYEKIEIPLLKVVIDMEIRGIKIDLEYLRKMGDEMSIDIIELQATIWKEAGKEFDINSPKQLAEVLFKEKKLIAPDEFRTKTGALSTNVKVLKYLEKKYPNNKLITSLFKYRELYKLNSTYIKGLLERHKDGIIYASFNQMGARTGRFSSSSPNLQNIPTREDKYDIRKAFVARDGYTFIDCDLSQIELRVAAFLSKDPTMIKVFQDGGDIHAETAKLMGCERKVAKACNFGVLFGTTSYGMAKNMDIEVEEAEKFITTYFKKFKKLSIFCIQCRNTLRNNYAIWTLTGRKRRFPDYVKAKKEKNWKLVKHIERQSVNTCVQGTAADLIKVQMRELAKVLPKYDAHLIMSVHDEVIVECPEEKAEEVLQVVKDTMENAIKLPEVPIVADGFISKHWKK